MTKARKLAGAAAKRRPATTVMEPAIDLADLQELMGKFAQVAEIAGRMDDVDEFDIDNVLNRDVDDIEVPIEQLPHGEGLPLPAYQSENCAGMDIAAAIAADSPVTLLPGARALVPTGFALQLLPGLEAQVRPRSGLALKHGVTVLNSPGTIDADYRGEVGVLLINHGTEPFTINRGDRIAQLVFAVVAPVAFIEEARLEKTVRGDGGWGSTGKSSTRK